MLRNKIRLFCFSSNFVFSQNNRNEDAIMNTKLSFEMQEIHRTYFLIRKKRRSKNKCRQKIFSFFSVKNEVSKHMDGIEKLSLIIHYKNQNFLSPLIFVHDLLIVVRAQFMLLL